MSFYVFHKLDDLTYDGNLFHRRGAAWENDRSPQERLDSGSEFARRIVWFMQIINTVYAGALLLRDLNTKSNHLYTILQLTGSQWNSCKIGAIWEDFFDKVITRAAEFWMRWRRSICVRGRPIKREWTMSINRETTTEWTICSVACEFKYFLILPLLWMRNDAVWTILETWEFSDIVESNMAPILRAWATWVISESSWGIETLGSCWREFLR